MSSRSGEEEMRLLKIRDRQFLEELFRSINPYLLRFCAANNVPKEQIEEIVHQTWESFFSNMDKFEGRSQLKTFICGILINKIRELKRYENRHQLEDDAENIIEKSFTDGHWNVEIRNPLKSLELQQSMKFITECMKGLTEQQKMAFVLREVEEEKSDDICQILKISSSHLRVLLFRAKDKLRKCVEGYLHISEG